MRLDRKLINKDGAVIRDPEKEETIQWNPRDSGIDIEESKRKRFRESIPTYMIKYAIHAQMTDVDCKYSIKVFSGDGKDHGSCGNLQVDSITDVQQISENLAQSFDFEQPPVVPDEGPARCLDLGRDRGTLHLRLPQKGSTKALMITSTMTNTLLWLLPEEILDLG